MKKNATRTRAQGNKAVIQQARQASQEGKLTISEVYILDADG